MLHIKTLNYVRVQILCTKINLLILFPKNILKHLNVYLKHHNILFSLYLINVNIKYAYIYKAYIDKLCVYVESLNTFNYILNIHNAHINVCYLSIRHSSYSIGV